jgi:hypothetical protein
MNRAIRFLIRIAIYLSSAGWGAFAGVLLACFGTLLCNVALQNGPSIPDSDGYGIGLLFLIVLLFTIPIGTITGLIIAHVAMKRSRPLAKVVRNSRLAPNAL